LTWQGKARCNSNSTNLRRSSPSSSNEWTSSPIPFRNARSSCRITGARTNLALLSRDLDEVRRTVEEANRKGEVTVSRWWMLVPPIIGAIASVLLSALVTYLLNRK
jgi:hypothetical protein